MKKITISIVFSMICLISFSQTPTDLELWTGGTFRLTIHKKLQINLQEQFRFNDTISTLKKSFTQLRVKYSINKFVGFGASYRFTVRPQKKNRSRVMVDGYFSLKKKDFPLSFGYRLRFQHENQLNSTKKYTFLRNKLSLKYNMSKLVDPFIAYELFYRFNSRNEFRTYRMTAGLKWSLFKGFNMSTYYRYEKGMNVKNPTAAHVIGLMFLYEVKIKK